MESGIQRMEPRRCKIRMLSMQTLLEESSARIYTVKHSRVQGSELCSWLTYRTWIRNADHRHERDVGEISFKMSDAQLSECIDPAPKSFRRFSSPSDSPGL